MKTSQTHEPVASIKVWTTNLHRICKVGPGDTTQGQMKSPKQQSWWEGETTHGGRSPHLLQFRVKPCTARTRADLGCRDLLAEWGINGGNASGAAETCPHEQWKQYREVVECTFKKNPTSNNKSNLWKAFAFYSQFIKDVKEDKTTYLYGRRKASWV